MRMQPTLDVGSRIDQKQLARSRVAMQADWDGERVDRRRNPISSRVGRRNLGGGHGQLPFKACMFMMRAALDGLLRFTKASAFGRPGWRARRPAERRESSMD